MTGVDHLTELSRVLGFLNPPIESRAKIASDPDHTFDVPSLTTRMARGEEAAFEEFHALYFHRLLRYLVVVARGREEIAHEALQLAFVRVARRVRKFDSEAAFWNWLAMLARNCVVDEVRKSSRYHHLLARFLRERPAEGTTQPVEADEPLENLLEREIACLPAEDRALIQRKYFNRETARDLAVEWRITEKAMESRLLRIRRKLKAVVLDRLNNETTD